MTRVTALFLGAIFASGVAAAQDLDALVRALRAGPAVTLKNGLMVHAPEVAGLIRNHYDKPQIERILSKLEGSLSLKTDSRGLVQASDRFGTKSDPTHYDAIWVRDSLWAYLALNSQPENKEKAKRLLLMLADYFASPDQVKRFEAVIKDPALIHAPDGKMRVPHIRFDGNSPQFLDVQENGKPQIWDHKQNDALGLFLDLFCRAVEEGSVGAKDLTPGRAKAIAFFPQYFAAVHFYEMEDAGSWEEIERVNTSSIALATSGLESLSRILKNKAPNVRTATSKLGTIDAALVDGLIDKGYARIEKQLKAGGESPLYDKSDPRYRTADAALLNLIFPARLSRLKRADDDAVLKIVEPLIGKVGIKRYLKDSYQAGNFWLTAVKGSDSKTGDTSSKKGFAERASGFIPDSEAQWFFDSWYSHAAGILYRRYHAAHYRALQIKYLNRSLAQITGGDERKPVLGADGKPVGPMALPESYNTVFDATTGQRYFVPSPITPLNWAKASLKMALLEFLRN